jgi:hypothetical protein
MLRLRGFLPYAVSVYPFHLSPDLSYEMTILASDVYFSQLLTHSSQIPNRHAPTTAV